jgi:hypothetical protein
MKNMRRGGDVHDGGDLPPHKKRRVEKTKEALLFYMPQELLTFLTSFMDLRSLAEFGSTCKRVQLVMAPHL